MLLINVESEDELRSSIDVARERADRRAGGAARESRRAMVETPHSYTRTGEKGNKFGIPFDEAREVAESRGRDAERRAARARHARRIAALAVRRRTRSASGVLLQLLAQLRADGARDLRYLDIGGGLGRHV